MRTQSNSGCCEKINLHDCLGEPVCSSNRYVCSVMAGAKSIAVVPCLHKLLFAVREPFQSIRPQTGITAGVIKSQNQLTIESLMPASGIIFRDGIETDFLKFNSGSIATIGIAKETGTLVKK